MEGIEQYGSQNNPQDQLASKIDARFKTDAAAVDKAAQNLERLELQSPPKYKKSEYAKILSNLSTFI